MGNNTTSIANQTRDMVVVSAKYKCSQYGMAPGGPFKQQNIYNFGCGGSSDCCFYAGPSGGINFCDTCGRYAFVQQNETELSASWGGPWAQEGQLWAHYGQQEGQHWSHYGQQEGQHWSHMDNRKASIGHIMDKSGPTVMD